MNKTDVKLSNHCFLEVHDTLTFLGSCFSEHIARSTEELAFNTLSNPFGVVFNPISLAEQITSTESEWRSTVFQINDKFLSWNSSSTVWGLERSELNSKLTSHREQLLQHISQSKVLFVTFGTAWIYELNKNGYLVANCHKQPQDSFGKRCLKASEIISKWNETLNFLKEINPELKIVFTVSPVRHKKDGLVENNISKAVLITAVHEICNSFEHCFYFPSYELIIDELRDYAYFDKDGVHPNRFAIEEIETRFLECFLSSEAKTVIEEFKSIQALLAHRVLHEGTAEARSYHEKKASKLASFLSRYPGFENHCK